MMANSVRHPFPNLRSQQRANVGNVDSSNVERVAFEMQNEDLLNVFDKNRKLSGLNTESLRQACMGTKYSHQLSYCSLGFSSGK